MMKSSKNSPITPSWCEWPEGCGKKATVQVVVFLHDTSKVEMVWYACDYHGGGGLGPNTCRLEDVAREGYDQPNDGEDPSSHALRATHEPS